jgi:hypothetical protein
MTETSRFNLHTLDLPKPIPRAWTGKIYFDPRAHILSICAGNNPAAELSSRAIHSFFIRRLLCLLAPASNDVERPTTIEGSCIVTNEATRGKKVQGWTLVASMAAFCNLASWSNLEVRWSYRFRTVAIA